MSAEDYEAEARYRFLFYARPDRAEENGGCWVWSARIDKHGYGRFTYRRRKVQAHRLALPLLRGIVVPADMLVLHSCDNRACVNPDHLRIGTHAENQDDKARRDRGRRSETGLAYGVRPARGSSGFEARACFAGGQRYLGTYSTMAEAAQVASAAKRSARA